MPPRWPWTTTKRGSFWVVKNDPYSRLLLLHCNSGSGDGFESRRPLHKRVPEDWGDNSIRWRKIKENTGGPFAVRGVLNS